MKTMISNNLIPRENRNLLLDGWWGIAILLVLQAHFLPIKYIHTGRFGVDVFFVLSGLLMSNILFVKRAPLKNILHKTNQQNIPCFFVFVSTVYLFSYFVNNLEYKNYLYTLTFLRTYLSSESIFWGISLISITSGH